MLNVIQKLSEDEILHGKDKNGTPYLQYVFELHKKLFVTTCSSCPGKIRGYIRKIKDYHNNKTMAKEVKQNYIMREGATISVLGTNKIYSRHNLHDKIALKLLKENPNRKKLFTKLPDNVDELVSKEKPDVVINTDSNQSKEDRRAELDGFHYTKLQDLVEGYNQAYENKQKAIELILSKEFES